MLPLMRLAQYLKVHNITEVAFAQLVGASAFGVRKWVRRERTPRKGAMRKIQEVTGGAVTASDFFDDVQQSNGALALEAQP